MQSPITSKDTAFVIYLLNLFLFSFADVSASLSLFRFSFADASASLFLFSEDFLELRFQFFFTQACCYNLPFGIDKNYLRDGADTINI